MKTIFIIDTYADNIQKEEILKKCIESIKPLGYDILITTHKQVSDKISNLVDYVLFDKDNRLNEINFYTGYIQYFPHLNFDIELYTTPDMGVKSHEFPIIKSIRNALSFANGVGYTQFIFSEFDSIFSKTDLNKITNMVAEMKYKKFSVLKNGDDGYDTIFFMGNTSFFLEKFNTFFPETIEEYNKDFTYQYPYRLEIFMYQMLMNDITLGNVINTKFSEYFDSHNKNLFRIGNYNAYIIPDQNKEYHVCVQNSNDVECEVEVFIDNISVYKDKLVSIIKNAYILKAIDTNITCIFKDKENILKQIKLVFDKNVDYSKTGKLILKW